MTHDDSRGDLLKVNERQWKSKGNCRNSELAKAFGGALGIGGAQEISRFCFGTL